VKQRVSKRNPNTFQSVQGNRATRSSVAVPDRVNTVLNRYVVVNELIKGFNETRDHRGRFITCGLCQSEERESIVPHMKLHHPEEWADWVGEFKLLRANGASFKEIMWQFRRLFSWTVIKRELALGDPLLTQFTTVRDFLPSKFKLEASTLWRFPISGKWATHSHIYPGNWAPQVPRNLILRNSKPSETVCDPFLGGGTTLVECLLLGRNGIGVDISPRAVSISRMRIQNLRTEARRQGYELPDVDIQVRWGDARDLRFIRDGKVDLVCTHPPYLDVIRYTRTRHEDLSHHGDAVSYLSEIETLANECRRILRRRGRCCLMIGDVIKKGRLVPLGLRIASIFEARGFTVQEIAIKEQENTSQEEFYAGPLRRKHEYIFVFARN